MICGKPLFIGHPWTSADRNFPLLDTLSFGNFVWQGVDADAGEFLMLPGLVLLRRVQSLSHRAGSDDIEEPLSGLPMGQRCFLF